MTAATRSQRVLGALLGVHAGDALGATFEFESWAAIQSRYPQGFREIVGGGTFDWPAGHATDDTDLTRAILLAYRDRHNARTAGDRAGEFDLCLTAGRYMLEWLDGKWPDRKPGSMPRDIGGATLTGLERFRESGDPATAGAGPGQAGNGSLMRCIPTALFEPDPHRLVEDSMKISAITHNDARCTISCAAYNVMVSQLIAGESPSTAIAAGLKISRKLEEESRDATTKALKPVSAAIMRGIKIELRELAESGPTQLVGRASGFVLESLEIAVAAVLDLRSLEDVLVDVVRIGMDTDTNTAIAGGLLGARDGSEAIPTRWKDILQFKDEFAEITGLLETGLG